jgi:hypothetical protein
MNRILFILAFTGILLQNFSKVYILVQFQINQDYIAQNLCVKKDIPNNCCKGKCHLQKQLDKDEKKLPASGNQLKEKSEPELYSLNCFSASMPIINDVTVIHTRYVFIIYENLLNSVFHPPQA